MPGRKKVNSCLADRPKCSRGMLTVLYQDVQALLDQQLVIEYDKPARQWQDVVAISDLEELANTSL
jgi:hypothetical protein